VGEAQDVRDARLANLEKARQAKREKREQKERAIEEPIVQPDGDVDSGKSSTSNTNNTVGSDSDTDISVDQSPVQSRKRYIPPPERESKKQRRNPTPTTNGKDSYVNKLVVDPIINILRIGLATMLVSFVYAGVQTGTDLTKGFITTQKGQPFEPSSIYKEWKK
jgi:hypothetical protein